MLQHGDPSKRKWHFRICLDRVAVKCSQLNDQENEWQKLVRHKLALEFWADLGSSIVVVHPYVLQTG